MIVPMRDISGKKVGYSIVYGIGGFLFGAAVMVGLMLLGLFSPLGREAGALIVVVFGSLMILPVGIFFAIWFAKVGLEKSEIKGQTRRSILDYIFLFLVGVAVILLSYIVYLDVARRFK